MSRKVSALKAMTEDQVQSYYCLMLLQSHLAQGALQNFSHPLFIANLNLTAETLQQVETWATKRKIDLSMCEEFVAEAFISFTPELPTVSVEPESKADDQKD